MNFCDPTNVGRLQVISQITAIVEQYPEYQDTFTNLVRETIARHGEVRGQAGERRGLDQTVKSLWRAVVDPLQGLLDEATFLGSDNQTYGKWTLTLTLIQLQPGGMPYAAPSSPQNAPNPREMNFHVKPHLVARRVVSILGQNARLSGPWIDEHSLRLQNASALASELLARSPEFKLPTYRAEKNRMDSYNRDHPEGSSSFYQEAEAETNQHFEEMRNRTSRLHEEFPQFSDYFEEIRREFEAEQARHEGLRAVIINEQQRARATAEAADRARKRLKKQHRRELVRVAIQVAALIGGACALNKILDFLEIKIVNTGGTPSLQGTYKF